MRKRTLSVVLSLLLFLGTQVVQAQTFNVSTTQELRQALLDAVGNGQADTIILANGTYATTDDGGGTFVFLDNENYDLTLQGSSSSNVILSGDNTHQVLNFNVINASPTIHLDNLAIMYGVSGGEGGGIYSAEYLAIESCEISGNTAASIGGGFHIKGTATITNSTISENTATLDGGGFYSFGNATITGSSILNNTASLGGGFRSGTATFLTNSTISGNISRSSGGGFYSNTATITSSTISGNTATRNGGGFFSASTATLTDSTISDNRATDYSGGGFYSASTVTIINSTILKNTAAMDGGGFRSSAATITNSTISGNTAVMNGGGFYIKGTATITDSTATIINSLFIDNAGPNAIYLHSGETHRIVNSVFLNNGNYDIAGGASVIVSMNNNYINEAKIDVYSFKSGNIFGGNLGFVDQANGDYHIGETSVLVDAGTTSVTGITFPATDADGNERIVGVAIDIGPYEVPTTRPNIVSFTAFGNLFTGQELTFTTVATPESGRTITLFEIDFGDGNYVTTSAAVKYTFYDADTYAVTARVTDSAGEFSTKTINITITLDTSTNSAFWNLMLPAIIGGKHRTP